MVKNGSENRDANVTSETADFQLNIILSCTEKYTKTVIRYYKATYLLSENP